jgi:hypothetical protein
VVTVIDQALPPKPLPDFCPKTQTKPPQEKDLHEEQMP